MSTYPSLNNDPEMLKIKTKDYEIKDFKYKRVLLFQVVRLC